MASTPVSSVGSNAGDDQNEKVYNNNINIDELVKRVVEAVMIEVKKLIEEMVPKLVQKEICRRIGGTEREEIREDSLEEGEWGSDSSPQRKVYVKHKNQNDN